MLRRLRPRRLPAAKNDGSTSHGAEQVEGKSIPDQGRGTEGTTSKQAQTSREDGPAATNQRIVRETTRIENDEEHDIYSVVFLGDGKHAVSGGKGGRIRQWRVEDGQEDGTPMNAGNVVFDIAVSRDGKWIVSGAALGHVPAKVWSVESHEKVGEMEGHTDHVQVVDISPDGSKIATGSNDKTACIWSCSTGERLLTLQHEGALAAVKFSPDGGLLATAPWDRLDVRVYNSEDGRLLVKFPIGVGSSSNQSLAWDHDSKHLYTISTDCNIRYLEVSTGKTLSRWSLRPGDMGRDGRIALPSNRRFIAATVDSSISFWDSVTHLKIGSDIDYVGDKIWSIAISENYDIAVSHGKGVTIWNLRDVLPSNYFDDSAQHSEGPREVGTTVPPTWVEPSDENIADPDKSVEDLQIELAKLRSQNEALSHELVSVREDLQASKISNEEKDRTIDGLAARVDQWRRSDAAKAEELAAARKELEERRRDSQELILVREELQFSQSQTIEVRQWYDEQFRQLKSIVEESQRIPFSVQNFITKADARAENAIIESLQRLNETVQRSSTFIAGCVVHDFQPRGTNTTEEQISSVRKITESIGQPLMNRLRSDSRAEVATYLPMAFRAYLTYHLFGIISSWSIENGQNQLIREIYKLVRELESQTISGRWRSVTYASIPHTCTSDPDMLLVSTISGLSDVVVAAGCASSASDAHATISSKFLGQLTFILAAAGQLTKTIMDALSGDYKVTVVSPAESFIGSTMEVEMGDTGKSQTKPMGRRVLCTTQLGLSKEVVTQSKVGSNKKNTVTVTTVVKAKVLPG
ncbi:WD40-repeat-containing domain protein [Chiua virens]|nr:WD40-repeat-containing domain protein [Chiua virens]